MICVVSCCCLGEFLNVHLAGQLWHGGQRSPGLQCYWDPWLPASSSLPCPHDTDLFSVELCWDGTPHMRWSYVHIKCVSVCLGERHTHSQWLVSLPVPSFSPLSVPVFSSWGMCETSSRSCLRSRHGNPWKTRGKEETRSWWPVWELATPTSANPSNKTFILTFVFYFLKHLLWLYHTVDDWEDTILSGIRWLTGVINRSLSVIAK